MAKGGPATESGKEVVRWNATQHGIRSPAPMVPGLEKVEDWEEHRSGVLESLSPEGHLENVLAERVALLSWRLHRVTRYERETIALSQERVEEDLARRRCFDFDVLADKHPLRRAQSLRVRPEYTAPPCEASYASRRQASLRRRCEVDPLGCMVAG